MGRRPRRCPGGANPARRRAGMWNAIVQSGDVIDAIVHAARRPTSADLIVMATDGRHGFLDAAARHVPASACCGGDSRVRCWRFRSARRGRVASGRAATPGDLARRPMITFTNVSQAVRPSGAVRRGVVPAQSGREGGAGGAERRRQDHAVPHDRRRGVARRGRGHGPEAADASATSGRTSARCRAARCSTRPSPAAARLGDLHHELKEPARPRWPIPSAPPSWIRILERFGHVQEEYERGGGYDLEARAREILHGLGFERRADRRRRRRAVGRLEDARRRWRSILLGAARRAAAWTSPRTTSTSSRSSWLEGFIRDYAGRGAHDLPRPATS